jgi:ABC-type transporter MlaC component
MNADQWNLRTVALKLETMLSNTSARLPVDLSSENAPKRYTSRTGHMQYLKELEANKKQRKSKSRKSSSVPEITLEQRAKFERMSDSLCGKTYFMEKMTEEERALFAYHYPVSYSQRVRPLLKSEERKIYDPYWRSGKER